MGYYVGFMRRREVILKGPGIFRDRSCGERLRAGQSDSSAYSSDRQSFRAASALGKECCTSLGEQDKEVSSLCGPAGAS